jgi:hypothetical protein
MNNNLNDYSIHIRRQGQGWTRGAAYHQTALELFLSTYNLNNPSPSSIEFPHPYGGNFVGLFRKISDDNSHCEYINESGQIVEVMMCSPAYAAYINRIVDF